MITLYHGTDNKAADKILETKTFNKSKGDNHWLGDGVYFYKEKRYAFRWIYIAYSKYSGHKPTLNGIKKYYTILKAEIDVKEDRIFDLVENSKHKSIFDETLNKCLERKISTKYNIVDGMVLNILFYKFNYKEKFDLIKAIFPHEDNDIPLNKTRLGYYPEVQYCVINTDIIGNISNDGKDDNNYLGFFSFAERYNESGNSNLITYKPKRKRIYK